ncbi:MAG: tRNA (adenine-N1)-methyltransferase [Actinomycetaceae bacterium]|nr:tRNA (adenine-N1)-methyltransferase [Actinomycetaceae bacterium]
MSEQLSYEVPATVSSAQFQAARRGPLRAGDRVQITDPKGRLHTVVLVEGGMFQCSRGRLRHDDLIGLEEGTTVYSEDRPFHVVRPLLQDYVMSMPRGAAIIYPKDAATIVGVADIFPGARVVEAGVGSGALTLSLLSAVGDNGSLLSVERRADFADIAAGNVDLWFGGRHCAWQLEVGDFNEVVADLPDHSVDRVVLDMLAPWECLDQVQRILIPGGVVVFYVATVTQLSRLREDLVAGGRFSEPKAQESMVRTWHLDGLAVRPDHRMVAHTGFLLSARTVSPSSHPQSRRSRPAPAAADQGGQWDDAQEWDSHEQLNPQVSPKKVRRARRQVATKVTTWLPSAGEGDFDE